MASTCPACGAPDPPSRCSGCQAEYYCDQACQLAAWKGHKQQCRAAKKKKAKAKALTPSALAQADPAMRHIMIGERLYPLITQNNPTISEHWAKITGMLLDAMDDSELLHLLKSPEALQARVQEALQVLKQYPSESQ